MFALLKFLQSLVKTLHSDGTPTQIAAGFALGASLGLTPLVNLHNLLVILALAMLNVSFGAGMFAMAVCAPLGFAFDPLFDRLGHALLIDATALRTLWTWLDNTPVLALASFDNTVVLGSVVVWLVLWLPIFFAVRVGVIKYRATVLQWLRKTRIYHVIAGSSVLNVYRWFVPNQ